MSVQDCVTSSLNSLNSWSAGDLGRREVIHLWSRLTTGATFAQIEDSLNKPPTQVVDEIINTAIAEPLPSFTWEDYAGDDDILYEYRDELIREWQLGLSTRKFRHKLVLFWHNHFVTEFNTHGCANYFNDYYKLLHEHAFGNFKDFVMEVGKTPAMLVYLNGNQNVASAPNENYARELLELFTLGEGNGYTEMDILGVARALTGWYCDQYSCGPVSFDAGNYDDGNKTIFGATSNYDYDGVHDLIFTLRANETARNICRKFYQFFVYPEINDSVVDQLAATFIANNFEIKPVLQQLLKSEHFFSEPFFNARIKSPSECLLGFYSRFDIEYLTDYSQDMMGYLAYMSYRLGQEYGEPVDVFGWPEHRDWINESTMTSRWGYLSEIIFGSLAESADAKLVNLAKDVSGNSNDPQVVTEGIILHMLGQTIDPAAVLTATEAFKGEIPQFYFDQGIWNLDAVEVPDQVKLLLGYLSRLPEFQMC